MEAASQKRYVARSTQIADIEPLELPLSRTMRFRDSNLEVAQLVNPPLDYDGVLFDTDDRVLGLWSSFAYENGRELASGATKHILLGANMRRVKLPKKYLPLFGITSVPART